MAEIGRYPFVGLFAKETPIFLGFPPAVLQLIQNLKSFLFILTRLKLHRIYKSATVTILLIKTLF
jgi:hypothetical protein